MLFARRPTSDCKALHEADALLVRKPSTPVVNDLFERNPTARGHEFASRMTSASGDFKSQHHHSNVIMHHVLDFKLESIVRQLYVSEKISTSLPLDICVIRTPRVARYIPFNNDFGPFCLSSMVYCIEALETTIRGSPSTRFVFEADAQGPRALTNAVFVLGAFMMLKLDMRPDEVAARFRLIDKLQLEDFRDADPGPADFFLPLGDCWRGLHRGMELSWVTMPSRRHPELWGRVDIIEYRHYAQPLNGDLHEVLPGRLFAFKGPRQLPAGREYLDDPATGAREFDPAYYVDIFKYLGVTTVVRLCRPQYDPRAITEAGLRHVDIYLDEGVPPSADQAARFLRAVDAAAGAVAVHCSGGLGRTGTMLALYLMRRQGFSAREAIAWLRLVRPGSVLGDQQHFLCQAKPLEAQGAGRLASAAATAARKAKEGRWA